MKTLNLHSASDYAANSRIELMNQVCEESISINALSKHGIHFRIQSCIIEHWSFKKGYVVKSCEHTYPLPKRGRGHDWGSVRRHDWGSTAS
jgi:hypothetical protein